MKNFTVLCGITQDKFLVKTRKIMYLILRNFTTEGTEFYTEFHEGKMSE